MCARLLSKNFAYQPRQLFILFCPFFMLVSSQIYLFFSCFCNCELFWFIFTAAAAAQEKTLKVLA